MGLVVRLDQDDDFASARSKLAAAVGRAVLVIPRESVVMNRTLAFQLLRRWSQDHAVELTIVAGDAPLKRLACEFGFRTVSSVRAAERRWRQDDALRHTPGWQAWLVRQRWRLAWWTVASIALALGLGWLTVNYLPIATVRLTPVTQSFSDDLQVTADPSVDTVDYSRLVVPARSVTAKVEGSDRLPATGKKEENARGFVTFGNLTDGQVRVSQGTVVTTTAGKKFTTETDAVLPSPKWSAVRVEVRAVDAGSKGETERLTVNKIEGLLASQVAVLNEQAIAIDKSRQTAIVTAADRDKLRASLLDRLTKQATSSLNSQIKQSEVVTAPTIKVEVVAEEYDHNVGDEAPILSLRLAVQAAGLAYDQRQVSDLARKAKETSAQGSQQILADSLTVSQPQLLGFTGSAMALAVKVQGLAIQPIDQDLVRRMVIGRPPSEAASLLQRNLGLVRPPEVTIDPAWARQANRVQIIVESAGVAP